MNITMNGKKIAPQAGANVQTLLKDHGYAGKIIAVACNGIFIAKTAYETTFIADGDSLEIVAPMQGG